jgi:hypothetical protein
VIVFGRGDHDAVARGDRPAERPHRLGRGRAVLVLIIEGQARLPNVEFRPGAQGGRKPTQDGGGLGASA